MHYYKRNIGDYAKKAARLSMLQHGAYTLLIDSCYDREKFPTLEEAIDWTWASSKEDIEAVEFVLRKFFTLEGDVYVQKRIQEEIEAYHAKAETNARIAKEREERRRDKVNNKTSGERTVHDSCTEREPGVHEPPPNQEPLTTNQEPLTKNQLSRGGKKPPPQKTSLPDDFTLTDHRAKLAADYWLSKERRDLVTCVHEIFEQFLTYAKRDGKRYLDWDAAWRTWYTNAVKFERSQNGSGGRVNQTAAERREEARRQWERENCDSSEVF